MLGFAFAQPNLLLLPPNVHARLAVEAGCREGRERWVGDRGSGIGVNRYGPSAPGDLVLEKYRFTVENVVAKAKALLGR